MASTDALPVPRKNVAYRLTFALYKNDGTLITGAAGLDSEVSKDGATFADCTNEATEIATNSGFYYLDLTSTEMNADCVAIVVKTSSTGAVIPTWVMYPNEAGDIGVTLSDGVAHGGTLGSSTATLALSRLSVVSQSANTAAITATGNGTGNGATIASGSGATGTGIAVSSAATNGAALTLAGVGTGNGLTSTGGATGHGISGVGGATSGNGIRAAGTAGNSAALNLVGQGSAAGLLTTGGATGHGLSAVGGATSGSGISAAAAASGAGIAATGVGTTQAGIIATGGSTSSNGISATGGGTGHGIAATSGAGATGNGMTLLAASTNGHGLKSTGTGTGDGAELTAGASGADLDADIAGTLTTVTTATNVAAVSAGAIAEASYATTAGSFAPLGILDQGTAQSATGTTLVLRAAAAFASSELIGATVVITGGSTGVGQARTITAYNGGTDTATVDAWTTTPTGTITYKIFATAPGSAPTVAQIADGVWDELLSGHAVSGSAGEALSAAGTAGDPWTTALPGAYGSGTAGKIVGDNINATISSRASQTSVDTIDDLLDTEIPALTTELAKVPKSDGTATWNATALASLQQQATDALNAYDPPTKAELDSGLAAADDATLAAIAALNNLSSAQAQTAAAAALTAYDPPTRAEATTDTNSVLTAVADVPTNAELATALGTADDATLAAIAAVSAKIDTVDDFLDTEIAALIAATYTRTGTAQAGAATTITLDSGASATDDIYNNQLIVIASGTGAGQARFISDYVGSTKVATVPTWVTNPSSSSVFYILPFGSIPGATAPTAAEVADAVWDEPIAGHVASGSTGEALSAAGGAGDPWITALPGAYSAGQAGYILGTNVNATISSRASQTSVDDLPTNAELATALAAADDATLAAIAALNNLSSAQAQTAAAAALTAYDPPTRAEATSDANSILTAVADVPTNAELATALATADDAVLAAIAALNNLSSAQAQTAAAAALTAYDPPTRAEATSDANSILTAVGDVPTNAELATALAAADDAVLAAIAALNNVSVAGILAATVEGTTTLVQSLRIMNAALGGKASGLDTTEATFRDLADTKDRIVAVVDADGNRTTVTRDLT